MSDNWIIVIPEDPDYLPSEEAQKEAVTLFQKIAPRADEVKAEVTPGIRFIDCGGNFEQILCPDCGEEIPIDWWKERMEAEAERSFPLDRIQMPCCRTLRNLNELKYEWPEGFARFSLEAMNPGFRDLTEKHSKQFEAILGCKVRKVIRHI